jgi:hypothetical protein
MTISGPSAIAAATAQPIAAKGPSSATVAKPVVQSPAAKVDSDGDHDGTVGTKIDVKA